MGSDNSADNSCMESDEEGSADRITDICTFLVPVQQCLEFRRAQHREQDLYINRHSHVSSPSRSDAGTSLQRLHPVYHFDSDACPAV